MSLPVHNDARQRVDAFRSSVVLPAKTAATDTRQPGSVGAGKEPGFSQLLATKVNELRFSAHAATRMKSRNIAMTPEVMGKLEKAVSEAAAKGARDSLVLLNKNAFIVNIPNRMVVTAMDGAQLKENVFTNIDSAVIVD